MPSELMKAINMNEVFSLQRRHRRVARWHIFKPKIPLWVNFGGSYNGRCWCILWLFGLFSSFWYILWPFGIFLVIWYIPPPRFGMFCKEKSGNPGQQPRRDLKQ
jgi:hypothetical protein